MFLNMVSSLTLDLPSVASRFVTASLPFSEATGGRLRNFIRRRVANQEDAEDHMQEMFFDVAKAYRLPKPIEQIGAWMYRVAINRITDLFRKNKPELLADVLTNQDAESVLGDLLPSAVAGPEGPFYWPLRLPNRGVLRPGYEIPGSCVSIGHRHWLRHTIPQGRGTR